LGVDHEKERLIFLVPPLTSPNFVEQVQLVSHRVARRHAERKLLLISIIWTLVVQADNIELVAKKDASPA